MKNYIFIFAFIISISSSNAQQFVSSAVIEYEVTSNIKKTMGNNVWDDMLKSNLPQFKIGYYNYTFSNNKSIYKFDHWATGQKIPDFLKKSDEENVWYFDHNDQKFTMQKNIFGSSLVVEDGIPQLKWRLTNESRNIAGYNCRKAVAKMFDSVYVFAFYTDEIMISGGPCTINGLPGMILGVTVPRLFTSWIAKSVSLKGVDENIIKPIISKKKYTLQTFKSEIEDHTKDWYGSGSDEAKQQKMRFLWGMML